MFKSYIFYCEINFIMINTSNNLSNYGRRHFKLFTNCHVSWDTLYQEHKVCIKNIFKHNIHVALLYCKQNVQTFNVCICQKAKRAIFFSKKRVFDTNIWFSNSYICTTQFRTLDISNYEFC